MKKIVLILCAISFVNGHLKSQEPCPPLCFEECPIPPPACAAACGLECGISYYTIGVGLCAVAVAAAIILVSGNGAKKHSKN